MRTAKKVITTVLMAIAIMIATNTGLTSSIDVQARASETGHTKKVSMKPFIWSEEEYWRNFRLETKNIGKLDAIVKACGINGNMTEYEAVDRFNTWITKNIKYDYDHSTSSGATMMDILRNKEGVCEQYARLFTSLCDRVGIKSSVVGSDEQCHAWNIVQIDGVWYHIDTCWNAGRVNTNPKNWFLLSESEILKDHGKISEVSRNESYFTNYAYTDTKYTINYNLKGGKNNKSNINTYYVSGSKAEGTALYSKAQRKGKSLATFKFKDPTRKGYIFKGWYNGKSKVTKLSQIAGKQNVTLTAKWTKVSKPKLQNVKMKLKTKKIIDDFYMDEIKLTWKKTTDTRYEIKYEYQREGYEKNKGALKTTKNTITFRISKGAKYKVTVRAYKQDSTGKKTYSKAKTFTNK